MEEKTAPCKTLSMTDNRQEVVLIKVVNWVPWMKYSQFPLLRPSWTSDFDRILGQGDLPRLWKAALQSKSNILIVLYPLSKATPVDCMNCATPSRKDQKDSRVKWHIVPTAFSAVTLCCSTMSLIDVHPIGQTLCKTVIQQNLIFKPSIFNNSRFDPRWRVTAKLF